MRIFLTGATSLIGAAVAPALVKAGHHVTAILRPTGPVPARLQDAGHRRADRGSLRHRRQPIGAGGLRRARALRPRHVRARGRDRPAGDRRVPRRVLARRPRRVRLRLERLGDRADARRRRRIDAHQPARGRARSGGDRAGGARVAGRRRARDRRAAGPGLRRRLRGDLRHAARRLQRHRPRRGQRRQPLAADLSRRSRRPVRPADRPRRASPASSTPPTAATTPSTIWSRR